MLKALALAVALPCAAHAQPQCAPLEQVAEFLTGYGEAPAVSGLMPQGLMEVWANPNTGTWRKKRGC